MEGWNEDGQALAETLDIQFDTYTQAVEAILADQKIAALLAEGGVMGHHGGGPQNDQCSRMLTDLETCTAGHRNTRCHTAQPQELEEAHDLGLSCGKYRAYLELYALDPSITPQQVGSMTMREIRDLLAQLENGAGSSAASSSSAAAGQGHGHHHGYGHPISTPIFCAAGGLSPPAAFLPGQNARISQGNYKESSRLYQG